MMRKVRMLTVLGWAALLLACNLVTWLQEENTPPAPAAATPNPTVQPPTATPTPRPTPTPTPDVREELRLAQRALFYGDWDTARQAFTDALQQAQDDATRAQALLGLGRVAYLARDYGEALKRLRKVKEAYPNTPAAAQADLYLALTYRQLQRYRDEAAAWQAYLERAPKPLVPYVYEWLGDALFNAADYGPAAAAYEAALRFDPFPPRMFGLYLGMGRSYHILSQWEKAEAAYTQALEQATNDFDRAYVIYLLGEMDLQRGRRQQAYERFLTLVTEYPVSPYAYKALVTLIQARRPVPDLERGIVDYYAKQYLPALRALKRYLANNPQNQDPAAYYYLGLVYRDTRNFTQAIEAWQTIIRRYPGDKWWPRAWEAIAETYGQWLHDDARAAQTYLDFVEQAPDHPLAPEFLYRAARYEQNRFDLEQAAQIWQRMAATYPQHRLAPRAFLLAAMLRLQQGELETARGVLEQGFQTLQDPYWRAAMAFWQGKLAAQQGDLETARQHWSRAVALDPYGYYGLRAQDMLAGRAPFALPLAYDTAIDWDRERRDAVAWMRQTFLLPPQEDLLNPEPLAQDPRYQRGLWLWSLGFYDEAVAEWEALRQAIQDDPAQTFRLIYEAQRIGMYRTSIFAARRILDLAGITDFPAVTAPRYFNYVRFGPYFADLVVPLAQEYGFHPLFVYALIRQESLFQARIASAAGAQGLMQIIPSTGEQVARQLGWPPDFTPEDLNRPLVSLRLGLAYFAEQYRRFGQNPYAALAAYNAGPGNAATWYDLAGDDPDLFLELIPFAETHLYIRRVYENYRMYLLLYARNP